MFYKVGSLTRRAVQSCRHANIKSTRLLSAMKFQSTEAPITSLSHQYIDCLYESWLNDHSSVHSSWDAYFQTGEYVRAPVGVESSTIFEPIEKTNERESFSFKEMSAFKQFEMKSDGQVHYYPNLNELSTNRQIILKNIAVHLFIRSFQMRGHRWANIDPLNLYHADLDTSKVFDLSLQLYGLRDSDLDSTFILPASSYIGGKDIELPLRDIIIRLQNVYCSSMGLEFMYINNYEQCIWLRQQFETPGVTQITKEQKWIALKRLVRASLLERFLTKKWPSEKRFGIEGGESVITAIKTVIDEASAQGVDTFIIGMPHRGRINVLANVTRQNLVDIFSRFNLSLEPSGNGSGDVKYHLGTCTQRLNRVTQKETTLVLAANPSHLEAVDPVVQGKCRARQFYRGDKSGNNVMSILIHGDAAFAGEGIVYETLDLSDLESYSTNGTVHIIVNNQIGFTTDPSVGRSSPYCTDVARVVNAPVFHVNGDDVDAVVYISEVAAKWRQRFKKDVVIDVVGYRRHGHNEMDDPSFTHPIMYNAIRDKKPVMETYAEQLIDNGDIKKETYENYTKKYQVILEDAFHLSENYHHDVNWIDSIWPEFDKSIVNDPCTGVDEERLKEIGHTFASIPDDINIHKGLVRILKSREKMIANRTVDWAIAEAMAIGSILLENKHVRLSGQDVERGTFSHRHHVLHDQKVINKTYVPLSNLSDKQAKYTICNSNLCEYGILGFELGYSTENPNSLILWEAQFGDFANNAQCIIDQFISSGEAKWNRQTGLVMLLPHAYEGSGPEHSSARIERFLQLCNADWSLVPNMEDGKDFSLKSLQNTNMIVANCTNPANYFHLLRRQLALPFRKPLIIFSPKSLLRALDAVSSFDDMTSGTRFKRIICHTSNSNKDDVKRIVFCSGHVYYDIAQKINKANLKDSIHVVSVEQICPFPYDLIFEEIKQYPGAEICWVQEEHKNAGAYLPCAQALEAIMLEIRPSHPNSKVRYIGRGASASTATGNRIQHINELDSLLEETISL